MERRDNAVQYNIILNTGLKELMHNINHQSKAETPKDTSYFTWTGELWGVLREYFGENWPRYNDSALSLSVYIYIYIYIYKGYKRHDDVQGTIGLYSLQEYTGNFGSSRVTV